MKHSALYLFGVAILCTAFVACTSKNSDNTAYNPYVDAFTSGTISKSGDVFVALTKPVIDDQWEKHLSVSPKINGKYTLSDDRKTLFITPDSPLKGGKTYTVKLNLKKLVGAGSPDDKFEFSFDVMDWNAEAYFCDPTVDDEDESLYNITLTVQTADNELPEEVESCGSFSEKVNVAWTHFSTGTQHTAQISGIKATEEARTLEYTFKSSKSESKTISVSVPSVNDFYVWDVQFVESPTPCVDVIFNKKLNPSQNLQGLAWIEGQTTTLYEISGNRIRLFPETGRKGEATVCVNAGIKSKSGIALSDDFRSVVDLGNDEPMLKFLSSGTILPLGDEIKVPFQARHLRGVIVRVIQIPEYNINQFMQENRISGDYELKRVGRLVARKTLFFDGDNFANTKTYAINLSDFVKMEPGAVYHIILSSNIDFSTYPGANDSPLSKKEIEEREAERALAEMASSDENNGWYYFSDISGDWSWSERDDPTKPAFYNNNRMQKSINVHASNLGLTASAGADRSELQVWVLNTANTQPEKDVTVTAYNYQGGEAGSATTDNNGFCIIKGLKGTPYLLVASKGKDRNYLRVDIGSALSTSIFEVDGETLRQGTRGFIYGERGVWRPGDTLHVGFILNDRLGKLPESHPVTLELFSPLDQLYHKKVQNGARNGLYCFHVPLEEDAPTGAWEAKIKIGGSSYSKILRVETIKPNRLKIDLKIKNECLKSEGNAASLHSEWLSGGSVHNLKYDLQAEFSKMKTSFSEYEKYVFDDASRSFSAEESRMISGKLDNNGNASLNIDLKPSGSAPGKLWATLTTKVYEESGDFSVTSNKVQYSPYSSYVGIKSPQTGDRQLDTDKTHKFEIVCLNEDGKPLANKTCHVQIFRVEWYWWWESTNYELADYVNQRYNKPIQSSVLTTDANGKASFKVHVSASEWGTYYARVLDDKSGHTTGIKAYFDWPTMSYRNMSSTDKATQLTVKTDKPTYKVGEVAKVTFAASANSRAIVSVENGAKVLSSRCEFIGENNATVEVPVTSDMQPNAYIHISLIQPYKQSQNDCPIRLYGYIPLQVDDPSSHLTPVISMPDELRPGSEYKVSVSEKNGKAMSYTLAIVDEGLLSLTNFKTPDPWKAFNAREALGVHTWDIYNDILGAYGGRIEQMFSVGGDESVNLKNAAVTNRFAPVVVFVGPFTIDEGKSATHTFTMPNYNGEVRVMVVATNGQAFGKADKQVPVRQSLMVLGTLPRTVGLDEVVTVPVTALTIKEAVNAKLTLTVTGGLSLDGPATQSVAIPKAGDKTVNFRIKTGNKAGTARVRIEAKGAGETAVYETDLTVANRQSPTSQYNEYTVAAGQSVDISAKTFGLPGTNNLSIEVSGIPPINLNQRLDDLIGYPHGCIEQTTSKIFAQLLLPDLCDLNSSQKVSIQNNVKAGLERLRLFQTASGGLAYWPGNRNANEWGSAYALHCMHKAEKAGYSLPSGLKQKVTDYVKSRASSWQAGTDAYRSSSETEQAYRLYVLAVCGKPDLSAMNRLKALGDLSGQARWLLAGSYAAAGRKDIATELAVDKAENYDRTHDYTFWSPMRDQAIKVMVLTGLGRHEEARVPLKKIANDLKSGQWLSTQSTLFGMYAISYYYGVTGREDSMNFTCSYNGETTSVQQNALIWSQELAKDTDKFGDITIKNKGKGLLYVKVKNTGTPTRAKVPVQQHNVALTVAYLDLEGNTIDPQQLEQGTNFKAVVTVKNPNNFPLRNLAVTQPVPSGWEILNTRFNSDSEQKADGLSYQDIRDDRVYSYIDALSPKASVQFTIKLCATYKGEYYMADTRVCEMYEESNSANTEAKMVVVK
ncbi:MAG: hypothetical protein J5808_00765 [Paludibacteraceae bacterium]|nr:hypothetical protein [Paludibacteraceae bacterium]